MVETLEPLVSKEEISTFHNEGAVRIRGALSQEWLDILAEGFDQAVESPEIAIKTCAGCRTEQNGTE